MASQQPVWTETETCEDCGGKVTFSLRNLSTKRNSWSMHLLSNKHKLHMTMAVSTAPTKAPVVVKASQAPSATSETCECGGCVRYHTNDAGMKSNNWKQHMLSKKHIHHTATVASAAPTKAPVTAPVAVKASQAPETTSETCHECGGCVRYHTNDLAMKANSWKWHRLSNRHKQQLTTVAAAAPIKVAIATPTQRKHIIEPCVECGGTIKYIRGCANDRDAARNQHITVSAVHTKWAATRKPPPKLVTAPQGTKTMSETCHECGGRITFPVGMPSMKTNCWKLHVTSNHHKQHAAATGSSAAPANTLVAMPASQPKQHVLAAAPAATKAPPECSAVTAARAFARRQCFAGAFSVVIDDDSLASSYHDERKELTSTTFRRAVLARDAIIDFVTLTGHAFMESELKIISVPRHSLQHSQRSLRRREVPTVESGTKREIVGALPFAVDLPVFKLPVDLRYEIPYPDTEAACRQRLKQSSYAIDPTEHLHNLLYCEEACVRASLREYDIEEGVFSAGSYHLYCLKVPGLAEKRPSVLVDDVIEAFDPQTQRCYRGYVYFVHFNEIHVHFDAAHIKIGQRYSIHFTCKRTEFRVLHRAIDQAKALGRPLLTAQNAKPPSTANGGGLFATMRWAFGLNELTPDGLHHNVLVPLNELQRKFVEDTCTSKAMLRILWGPPGTGKTTTLVAYIAGIVLSAMQSKNRNQDFKILVATPSNGASNLITSKLLKYLQPKKQLLRVMAFSRQLDEVPEDVRACCCTMSYVDSLQQKPITSFRSPNEIEVESATVIVATLGSCSRLFSIHPQLCFSHVIVDECGQATEPEFAGALQFAGLQRVTIAGDPQQLGPITVGLEARSKGLGTSPLVRLIEQEDASNTMLRDCYRCHPEILRAFNPVFYKGKLNTPATGVKFSYLPVLGFEKNRVQIYHCDGPEGYANNSPSIMNVHEVEIVANQLKRLRALGVALDDVVVLAPYALQVKKLREMFGYALNISDKGWMTTHVCSVEAFQGREAKYVIISCVRSPEELSRLGVTSAVTAQIAADARRHLGFLSQPQRSNVALSRAIDGLILVGNLRLLAIDKVVWGPVITSLRKSGADFFGTVTLTYLDELLEAFGDQTDAVVGHDVLDGDTTQNGTRRTEE